MMNFYKVLCEESEDQEDIRLYQTVNDLYISDNKKTVEQVAKFIP